MTPVNLGVCFGPSLLRPEVETVSSIYDIKFRNAIVELIIIHYEKMFKNKLEQQDIDEMVGTNENGENSVVNLSNSLSSLAVRTTLVRSLPCLSMDSRFQSITRRTPATTTSTNEVMERTTDIRRRGLLHPDYQSKHLSTPGSDDLTRKDCKLFNR